MCCVPAVLWEHLCGTAGPHSSSLTSSLFLKHSLCPLRRQACVVQSPAGFSLPQAGEAVALLPGVSVPLALLQRDAQAGRGRPPALLLLLGGRCNVNTYLIAAC